MKIYYNTLNGRQRIGIGIGEDQSVTIGEKEKGKGDNSFYVWVPLVK